MKDLTELEQRVLMRNHKAKSFDLLLEKLIEKSVLSEEECKRILFTVPIKDEISEALFKEDPEWEKVYERDSVPELGEPSFYIEPEK